MKIIFFLLSGLTAFLILFWIKLSFYSPLKPLYPLAPFVLTNQDNQSFSSSTLKGHIFLTNFIFTNCGGPCPLMTQKFVTLSKKLPDSVKFLSLSVDPKRDTPEVLKEYAKKNQINTDRHQFLTGTREEIIQTMVGSFKIGTFEDPNLHSSRFVLVDAQQNVLKYYESTDANVLEAIANDLKSVHRP